VAAATAAAAAARDSPDELRTDVAAIAAAIARLGADNVLCVVTTTSCFAPRAPDAAAEVAALCAGAGVGHVVNHAYGLQSSPACHELNEACRAGRVDAWVASTDKNFMVPVGGAIVGSPSPEVVEAVSRAYPGRASAAPIADLFITLLAMGESGLRELLQRRRRVFARLLAAMEGVAARCGERVLRSPRNAVSIAMTIDNITTAPPPMTMTLTTTATAAATATATTGAAGAAGAAGAGAGAGDDAASSGGASGGAAGGSRGSVGGASSTTAPGNAATYLGSMLFARGVSGTRVVAPGERRSVGPLSFEGYGASCDAYGCAYLTAAAAIGMTEEDVDVFAERLEATIAEYRRQAARGTGGAPPAGAAGAGAGAVAAPR